MNTTRLRAKGILRTSTKAAFVQLEDNTHHWLPFSQCPDLQKIPVGESGEFDCPTWLLKREKTTPTPPQPLCELHGTILAFNDQAAFVKLDGNEEIWLPFERCPQLSNIPLHNRSSFSCPRDLLVEKGLLHYALQLNELIRDLKKGTLSIFQAIHTQKIPEIVLHSFAYDCATRNLLQVYKTNKQPHLALWKALQVKRQWIIKEANEQELEHTRQALKKMWTNANGTLLRTISSVWDATDQDARTAANGAAQYLSFGIINADLSVAELARGLENPLHDPLILERSWQSHQLALLIQRTLHPQISNQTTTPHPQST